jgi:hypothetical protein
MGKATTRGSFGDAEGIAESPQGHSEHREETASLCALCVSVVIQQLFDRVMLLN